MIRLHAEFDTKEEAELWRDGMYMSYHPLGYSTHITIERRERVRTNVFKDDGRPESRLEVYWVAFGSRAESCD